MQKYKFTVILGVGTILLLLLLTVVNFLASDPQGEAFFLFLVNLPIIYLRIFLGLWTGDTGGYDLKTDLALTTVVSYLLYGLIAAIIGFLIDKSRSKRVQNIQYHT